MWAVTDLNTIFLRYEDEISVPTLSLEREDYGVILVVYLQALSLLSELSDALRVPAHATMYAR